MAKLSVLSCPSSANPAGVHVGVFGSSHQGLTNQCVAFWWADAAEFLYDFGLMGLLPFACMPKWLGPVKNVGDHPKKKGGKWNSLLKQKESAVTEMVTKTSRTPSGSQDPVEDDRLSRSTGPGLPF